MYSSLFFLRHTLHFRPTADLFQAMAFSKIIISTYSRDMVLHVRQSFIHTCRWWLLLSEDFGIDDFLREALFAVFDWCSWVPKIPEAYFSATVCCSWMSNSARSTRSLDCFNFVCHSLKLSVTINPPSEPCRRRVSMSSRSFLNAAMISFTSGWTGWSSDASGLETNASGECSEVLFALAALLLICSNSVWRSGEIFFRFWAKFCSRMPRSFNDCTNCSIVASLS